MSSMAISLARHDEQIGTLQRDVAEHDEQIGTIARDIGRLSEDMAVVRQNTGILVEQYFNEHPSKVAPAPTLRPASRSEAVKLWGLVGAVVALGQVVAELAKAILTAHH